MTNPATPPPAIITRNGSLVVTSRPLVFRWSSLSETPTGCLHHSPPCCCVGAQPLASAASCDALRNRSRTVRTRSGVSGVRTTVGILAEVAVDAGFVGGSTKEYKGRGCCLRWVDCDTDSGVNASTSCLAVVMHIAARATSDFISTEAQK